MSGWAREKRREVGPGPARPFQPPSHILCSLSPSQNDEKWSKAFMRLIKVTEPLTKKQTELKNKTQDALTAVRFIGEEREALALP